MTDRPLLLLDSASLYFRAFFGVPDSVRAPDGTPVNAVRGLLDMIATLVTTRRPDRLVACWDDDWRPQFRVDAIPSYKAHRVAGAVTDAAAEAAASEVPAPSASGAAPARSATTQHGGGSVSVEEVPADLEVQVPVIVDVLAALGIARIGAPGFEADDVIGTLVAREVARTGDGGAPRTPVEVVTGDRDLFQLVDDEARVSVLYTARGIRDLETVDQARLREKYGVASGPAYADMATLRGDTSDGLPGVRGIGEKTAAQLIGRYGDLAALLAARDAHDPGLTLTQRTRLLEAADYLAVAPVVVQVARDAPVGDVDDALPRTPVDADALVALAERWGLVSSVQRVVEALTKVS